MAKEKEKIITIRGINETYYNQFQSLTRLMKTNIGPALSELITHYKKPMPPILGTTKMRGQVLNSFNSQSENLEIIDGIKELILTKDLLEQVGKNTKFILNNIENVMFEESVTNDLIIQYIFRITNSNVHIKGKISNLLLYSLCRTSKDVSVPKNIKEVTIRNVNASAYNDFVALCQLHNESIGEAINSLWAQYIPEAEIMFIVTRQLNSNFKDLLVITNIDEVIVVEEELIELNDRKVLFHRISKLTFDKSITKDSFQKYVIGIYNCDSISLLSNIPKLLELSRVKTFP